MGFAKAGKTLSLTREFIGKWGYSRASKQQFSLTDPSPTDNTTMQQRGLPCPGKYLRRLSLPCNSCTETKKYSPNERTDQNSRKRSSNEETDNLSNVEFKTLVIRMLTETTEFSCKMKKERKAIQNEIKETTQGTNREGKETGTQVYNFEQKEEINIQPEQNEETRIQKKEKLLNLCDNFNQYPNYRGARRRRTKGIENLFE